MGQSMGLEIAGWCRMLFHMSWLLWDQIILWVREQCSVNKLTIAFEDTIEEAIERKKLKYAEQVVKSREQGSQAYQWR